MSYFDVTFSADNSLEVKKNPLGFDDDTIESTSASNYRANLSLHSHLSYLHRDEHRKFSKVIYLPILIYYHYSSDMLKHCLCRRSFGFFLFRT